MLTLGRYQPQKIQSSRLKEARLDSKIELYVTHRNGSISRAKTDLSDVGCM